MKRKKKASLLLCCGVGRDGSKAWGGGGGEAARFQRSDEDRCEEEEKGQLRGMKKKDLETWEREKPGGTEKSETDASSVFNSCLLDTITYS